IRRPPALNASTTRSTTASMAGSSRSTAGATVASSALMRRRIWDVGSVSMSTVRGLLSSVVTAAIPGPATARGPRAVAGISISLSFVEQDRAALGLEHLDGALPQCDHDVDVVAALDGAPGRIRRKEKVDVVRAGFTTHPRDLLRIQRPQRGQQVQARAHAGKGDAVDDVQLHAATAVPGMLRRRRPEPRRAKAHARQV